MSAGVVQFIPLILIIAIVVFILRKKKSKILNPKEELEKSKTNISSEEKKQTWKKILISFFAFLLTAIIVTTSSRYDEEDFLQFMPLIIGISTYWILSKKGNFLKKIFNKATDKDYAFEAGKFINFLNMQKSPKILYYVAGIAIVFAVVSFFNNTRAYDTAGTAMIILTVVWVIFLAVISLPDFKKKFGGRVSQSQGAIVGWIIWAILIGLLSRCSIH